MNQSMKLVDALKWMTENKGIEFTVKFLKADNTLRIMRAMTGVNDGTLAGGPVKKKSEDVVTIYDLDKKEYRSFRKDKLVGVKLGVNAYWQDIEEAMIINH